MRYFMRTGLAAGVISVLLALASVTWAEYSARDACAKASSLPAPPGTGAEGATLAHRASPTYHIGEEHSIFVDAPPERVFDALGNAGNYERPVVRLFGLLPLVAGTRRTAPSSEESIYGELKSSSGLVLEEPNRELVAADLLTSRGRASSIPRTARGFAGYRLRPDEMKGVVNLRADPVEGGTRLSTATIMTYGDVVSCRDFGRYWGAIYPGSSLYRIELLETIKRRVESDAASPPGAREGDSFETSQRPEDLPDGALPGTREGRGS